jgi:hypothetical protein
VAISYTSSEDLCHVRELCAEGPRNQGESSRLRAGINSDRYVQFIEATSAAVKREGAW